MNTYNYYGPSQKFIKNVTCENCGKRLRRQRTINKTVNPFNRNSDGTQKTWDEVLRDVVDAGKRWLAKPERCSACQGGES